MTKHPRFSTAGEALAAMEDVLDQLGGLGHAEDQLNLIARLRRVAGRASSLVSVWVAESDRAGAARHAGVSMSDWLTRHAHADRKEALGLLRSGEELLAAPTLMDAAVSGEVTPHQLEGINRTLRDLPEQLSTEQREAAAELLIQKAQRMTPQQLARQADNVTRQVAPEAALRRDQQVERLERQRARALSRRSLTFRDDHDGSIVINGSLPTLEGHALKRLIAGYVASDRARNGRDDTARSWPQRQADALVALLHNHGIGAPLPGLAGYAPTIVVTMTEADLRQQAEQAGVLPSGQLIDAGSLRRLCCDANVIPLVLGGNSVPLDVGAAHRTVTPAMRIALSVRDGGCRFPGCEVPDEACEAHHVDPWWRSRRTSIDNLVLLCAHHHRLVEPNRFWAGRVPDDRWSVQMIDGQPVFKPPATCRE